MASVITFKFLRDLQKKERDSASLTKIPDDFYDAVSDYLARKQRISMRDSMKSFTDLKEIENTRPVIKYIFDRREQKIMNSAIRAARTDIKIENLTNEEMLLFDAVRSLLKKRRSFLEDVVFLDEEKKGGPEEEKPAESTADGAAKESEIEPSAEFVKIEVTGDIPEFVAEDLETYGPWSAGEIVVAPLKAAMIFVDAGKAKRTGQ